MKITSIEVVQIPDPLRGYEPAAGDDTQARRPSWVDQGPVANPMTRYPRYAASRRSWSPLPTPYLGCVVHTQDGNWGFAPIDGGLAPAVIIASHLGPRLAGENAMATEKIYDMAVRMCAHTGATGIASYAVSAIDLAIWDVKGKILGRPVYELIGGPARDDLQCYATGGDVDWYLECGFTAIKLPCPYGPADGAAGLRRNVELVAAAREQAGDDVELMLDCWQGLDVEYTVALAQRLRPYRLRWLEECLQPEQFGTHARLRARLPWQSLAGGEHWHTPAMFSHAVRHDLADVLQPDIQWVGGLTALLKICAIAEAAGVTVIPHAGGATPYGQHACYALPAIEWAEFYVPTPPGVQLRGALAIPGIPTPVNGRIRPSSAPGFGVPITLDQLSPVQPDLLSAPRQPAS